MNATQTTAGRVVVSVKRGEKVSVAAQDAAARKVLASARIVTKVTSRTHTLRIYAG